MRNMVLAATGVAALLVSPAAAQSARPPMPSNSTVPTRCARVRGPICGQRRRSVYAILAGSAVATRAEISGNPADSLLISLVVSLGGALSARRILLCRLKPGRPAFQVEGASASNQSFNWKLFRLDRMRDARFQRPIVFGTAPGLQTRRPRNEARASSLNFSRHAAARSGLMMGIVQMQNQARTAAPPLLIAARDQRGNEAR